MYCNLDKIIKASSERDIIQLTDDARTGVVDTAVVDEMIRKADRMIDSYVGGRYSTPLAPAPELIADISTGLAIYFLYERRNRANMPESITKSYSNYEKQLTKIREGGIDLEGVPEKGGSVDYGTGQSRCNKNQDSRILGWDVLDKY